MLLSRIKQPFWPVALLSTLLAATALMLAVNSFFRTSDSRALLLVGLTLFSLLVHLGAFWMVIRKTRPGSAIIAITLAELLTIPVAPLFLSGFLPIGLLVLVGVPLQVGIVNRLRLMPLFVIFGLLATAVAVTMELLAPGARLAIRPDEALIGWVGAGLHLSLLGLVIWRLRLRPSSPHYTRIDLATQLALVFAAIAGTSIMLVGGVLISQIRSGQIERVGRNFQTLAEINAERVANMLEQQINALILLSRRDATILDGIIAMNEQYPADAAEARRAALAKERIWRTSEENSPFVLSYRNNPQTQALSFFRGGDLLHNNLFITDSVGGLVAAQGDKPDRFYYGDTSWWKSAWNSGQGGVYLGRLQVDFDDGEATIFIAVSILDPRTNRVIGVLASTYRLRAIQRDISLAAGQIDGEVDLMASDGVLIAGPDNNMAGRVIWPSLVSEGVLPSLGTSREVTPSAWLLGTDSQGRAAVVAHAPLATANRFNLDAIQSLGWRVVVGDSRDNALAEVNRSTLVASLVGLLVMALVVLAASGMASLISKPIESLTRTAAAMSSGDLNRRAEAVGPSEFVTLAEAFNTLTMQLRQLINNLQEQVRQRTAQLEARADQLGQLYQLGQELSARLDPEGVYAAIHQAVARLMVCEVFLIALYDEEAHEVVMVYAVDREQRYEPVRFPVSRGLAGRVITTGEPLKIGDFAALAEPDQLDVVHFGDTRQARSALAVPLRRGDKAIGALTTQSYSPHAYTPDDEQTLGTLAAQAAIAIENARFFAQVQQAREAADVANEAKSVFLANVSHELRTPLTSMLGFAKIIARRLDEVIVPAIDRPTPRTERATRQARENLNIIVAEGDRLTVMINDLLDLAKIEAGRFEWNMQPVDLGELIERATRATQALFSQKDLLLVVQVQPGLPLVRGDSDRLLQVIINLLSNAVKFTERGRIVCKAERVEGEVWVQVHDTGGGIAAEDHALIFERFRQVGDPLTDKPRGTGLGLPICKQIVEHHHGRIWVDSALGQGSTFTFALPVLEEQELRDGSDTVTPPAEAARG